MKITGNPPGFDKSQYEFECLVPGCEGKVLLHFANLHKPPKTSESWACHVLSKCLECGKIYSFEPVVTEKEKEHLVSLWGGRQYFPWSEEHGGGEEEMKKIYSKETKEEILKKLEDLGYF